MEKISRLGDLWYNGIPLSLTHVNSISSTPVYSRDDDQYLYTKYVISASGIINPNAISFNSSGAQVMGELPGETYIYIRGKLMEQGKEFVYTNKIVNEAGFADSLYVFHVIGQSNLLNNDLVFDAFDAVIDMNDGPRPVDVTITRVDGSKTYHINFTIEFNILECKGNRSRPTDPLLSVRFSQSQTLDREFYTTVVTRGEAYFALDILQNYDRVADEFRGDLLPNIPPGFRRMEINFGINPKGNIIEFECIDKELAYELGDTGETGSGTFITHADGFFSISTMNGKSEGGEGLPSGFTMATMNVKLWGSKKASNWDLTQIAFQIMQASNKMPIGNPGVGIVHQFQITQSITERFVDVTLSMRLTPDAASPFGTMRTNQLKVDNIFPNFNGINPAPPLDKGTRGNANLRLLSSKIKEACALVPAQLNATGSGGLGPPPVQGPPPVIKVSETNRIPSASTNYSQEQTQFPYSKCTIDSYYETKNGVYQAPVSGSAQTTSSGNQTSTTPIDASCSIVDLHRAMTRRVVEWSVERYGKIPDLPAPASNNPNQRILETTINPAEVSIMPDGVTPSYKVTGRYVYALKKSITDLQGIDFDIPQWINYPYGSQRLQLPDKTAKEGGNFKLGIINP